MAQHAKLSPSGAERWMACPGSLAMEDGLPDTSSTYSDEGTAAHFLASVCLERDTHPATYIGSTIVVGSNANIDFDGAVWSGVLPDSFKVRREYAVHADMAGHVNQYVQAVKHHAADGTLLVERRLAISTYTGEEGGRGTADAVVITPEGELQVHDLKYGMTPVNAEKNPQLMLYALGALEEYGAVAEFTGVRMFIHQPRIGKAASEWACSVSELLAFGEHVKERAFHAHQVLGIEDPAAYFHHLRPSDAACLWCKAKAKCPALSKFVTDTIGAEFEDLTSENAIPVAADNTALSTKLAACGLIEKWIKAVRAAVEGELFAGHPVPGYKLVAGKKGARSWGNVAEAEAMLKTMRLKMEEMYDLSVITPPQVEKIFGPKGSAPSAKRWNKLQVLITQKDGQPSVAPEGDKRPALVINPTADFEDETGEDLA